MTEHGLRTTRSPTKKTHVDRALQRDASAKSDGSSGGPLLTELFNQRFSSASVCRILLAAVDSFSRKGFHASSTRDIARKARLSPAAVYVHFRSKEELLYAIVIVVADWTLDQLLAASRVHGTPTERLRHLVKVHVTCHAALRTAMYVANYEFPVLKPQQRRRVIEIRDKVEQLFADCLSDGCQNGEFKLTDLRLTKIAVVSLCVSVLNWFSARGSLTPEMLGDRYADLVIAMVTADTH